MAFNVVLQKKRLRFSMMMMMKVVARQSAALFFPLLLSFSVGQSVAQTGFVVGLFSAPSLLRSVGPVRFSSSPQDGDCRRWWWWWPSSAAFPPSLTSS